MYKPSLFAVLAIVSSGLAAQPVQSNTGFQNSQLQDSHISVPWSEFSELYKDHLESDWNDRHEVKPVFSIESADWEMSLANGSALATLTLRGSLVAGEDATVPLGLAHAAITNATSSAGSTLVRDDFGYALHVQNTGEFALSLTLASPLEHVSNSKILRLAVPAAIRNSLQLDMPEHYRLVSFAGYQETAGRWHFATRDQLELRIQAQTPDMASDDSDAPLPVLGAAIFDVQITESGRRLTRLVAELPKDFGNQLIVSQPDNGTFWALKLNGQSRSVNQDDDNWLIALSPEQSNRIELSWLEEGPELGLDGRVDISLPNTGLNAQVLRLNIQLPDRVHLVGLEGRVEVATKHRNGWFNFQQPFYQGSQEEIAIHYREPLEQSHQQQN